MTPPAFQPIRQMQEGTQTLEQYGYRFPDGTIDWAELSSPSVVNIEHRRLSAGTGTLLKQLYTPTTATIAISGVATAELALARLAEQAGLDTSDNKIVPVKRTVIIVATEAVVSQ